MKKILTILLCLVYMATLVPHADAATMNWGPKISGNSDAGSPRAVVQAPKAVKDPCEPPRPDDLTTKLTMNGTITSSDGCSGLLFSGSPTLDDAKRYVDRFIESSKEHGYSLSGSAHPDESYYVYWLGNSSGSLKSMTYKDRSCQMAVKLSVNSNSGTYDITVYYSPSIADDVIDKALNPPVDDYSGGYNGGGGGYSGGGNSGGSSSSSSSSGGSSYSSWRDKERAPVRCFKCDGDGKVSCSNCSGRGYKTKRVSTPNYSGKRGGVKYKDVKENCYRCRGSGTLYCSRCGGDGKS